ncbi:MAG: hypothetical protein ABIP39_12395 [Polyangiaceae bacterium]
MVTRSAWVLNFDAEDELAQPGRVTSGRALESRRSALEGLVRDLIALDDVIVRRETRLEPGAFVGRAWCPTPQAVRLLGAAGARALASPSFEILRRVNHRAFAAELGQTLPGARFVRSRAELEAALAREKTWWLLKRPFGFAGRGRMRVLPERILANEERWIEASLRTGEGLQVEPFVERTVDFALHGFVRRAGTVILGAPTRQECDPTGAWRSSVRLGERELSSAESIALVDAAREAGLALAKAGYFGPFGIDGFRWTIAGGEPSFNPRCEINARYSMGWATGMGTLRPDLDGETEEG